MELPASLRAALDRALSGATLAELGAAAADLSQRYRQERRDGRPHVASERDALAYLAVRLPATYAAVRASFVAVAQARADFAPATMLDVGAGPGTALWAAADCWPDLHEAWLVEASPVFRACAERLMAESTLPKVNWQIADVTSESLDFAPCDLVVLAYTLNELAAESRPEILRRLWQRVGDILIVIEPGTPAGWQRIIAARHFLIENGGHVIAPCPHDLACPLQSPDWCHFAERLGRSRLHRQVKNAEVAFEDEKFSYVAVSRQPLPAAAARVIARPRKSGGHSTLKLCQPDGTVRTQVVSRRDGALFKRARRANWGSSF